MQRNRILISLILLFSLFSQFEGFGQTLGLKVYPFSLITGKVAVQGEYSFAPNKSITLDVSRRAITVNEGIIGELIADNVEEELSGDYTSFQVGIAYRKYSEKKEGPKGFYFSPGVKYASTEMDLVMDLDEFENTAISVSTSMFGAHFDIGTQWMIGNNFVIDWNFIGIGLQYGSAKGSVTSDDLSALEAEELAVDLNAEIEDIPLIDVSFEANGNTVSMDSNLIFPVLRSRLSIGFFF